MIYYLCWLVSGKQVARRGGLGNRSEIFSKLSGERSSLREESNLGFCQSRAHVTLVNPKDNPQSR